jgi:hypothetical protein
MSYMRDMAESNRKRRPPRKRQGTRPRPLGEETALAVEIYRKLRDLHLRLAGREGDDGVEALSISFHPDGDEAAFARRIIDAFRARGEGDRKTPHFEEGRVYCYHCESAGCEHARPPGNLSVFAGYTPTGFPVWSDFFTVLLERRDPRIDELIEEPPEVVALYQKPVELKAEQLRVFGRDSSLYDIVGQVVAGYLPLPRGVAGSRGLGFSGGPGGRNAAGAPARTRSRAALTVQAVNCRIGKRHRLRLNVIGCAAARPGGSDGGDVRQFVDVADLLKLEPEPELQGFLTRARKKLEEIGFRNRFGPNERDEAADRAQPVLTRLARGIESIYRRRRRRTQHAAERRTERPAVGMALKDLEKAHPDRLLFDEVEHTFVAIGPKWRVHVFGRDGRHVTSLVLNRDGVRRRIDKRRWRYTTRSEMEEIRSRVASLMAAENRDESGRR